MPGLGSVVGFLFVKTRWIFHRLRHRRLPPFHLPRFPQSPRQWCLRLGLIAVDLGKFAMVTVNVAGKRSANKRSHCNNKKSSPMKNLSKATQYAAACLLAALLSGCATAPKTDLSAENRNRLHSIVVLEVDEPKEVSVIDDGSVATAFALIGGLVQAGINKSHTDTYMQEIASKGLTFAPIIAHGISDRLAADGYQVAKLDGQSVALDQTDKPEAYAGVHTDADAIMNVWFTTFGYRSPPNKVDFIPWVTIRAQLLDAKTKQDIYAKTFVCGDHFTIIKNSIHIESGEVYGYGDFADLMENFNQSIDGLKACEKSIVDLIGKDLARAH